MGCDIHLCVEYKDPENTWSKSWSGFGNRYYAGRDYSLFGFLAGVRGEGPPIAAPRGYPDDADYMTNRHFYYYIGDKNEEDGDYRYVTLETAKKYGWPVINDKDGTPSRIQDPDAHTPSWLTWSEFTSALILCETKHRNWLNTEDAETRQSVKELYAKDLYKFLIQYKAIAAAMETLEKAGYMTRIVFWFDN